MEIASDDRCSFCGKRRDQVERLIAGQKIADQHVFICNECVALASPVVQYDPPTTPPAPPAEGWMDRLRRIGAALPR